MVHTSKIRCSKCGSEFSQIENLKYRIRMDRSFFRTLKDELFLPWKTGLESVHSPNIIVCPKCGNEFEFVEHNLLGIFQQKSFRMVLIFFIGLIGLAFLLFPILIILKNFLG